MCVATCASAQEAAPEDTRTQYPPFLANSYFTLDVGRIGYVFSGDQLEPGFRAASVDVPGLAVRVDLFGHHFTKHLSVQATYMRPARFVAYHNVNGNPATHQVSTAYAGLTLVWEMPLNARLSAYGEAGGGITSRSGFEIDGTTALQSAHYAAGLLGAGLAYHATRNADVIFGATYSPGRKSLSQPSTRLYTTGLRIHMRPLPAATVEENRRAGFTFPRSVVRLGYTTNLLTLRRQQLLLAEGADFLGRQRGDEARLHARLPAQRVPHQEGVRLRSRRERVDLEKQREPGRLPHRLRLSALQVLSAPPPGRPTSISATRSRVRPSSARR